MKLERDADSIRNHAAVALARLTLSKDDWTCGEAVDVILSTIAETHVVVPRRSTPRMDTEGVLHLRAHPCDASGCYEAMLAASQQGGE